MFCENSGRVPGVVLVVFGVFVNADAVRAAR